MMWFGRQAWEWTLLIKTCSKGLLSAVRNLSVCTFKLLVKLLQKGPEKSSLHWLVLVLFNALFVQWSILANKSFKETKRRGKGGGGWKKSIFSLLPQNCNFFKQQIKDHTPPICKLCMRKIQRNKVLEL